MNNGYLPSNPARASLLVFLLPVVFPLQTNAETESRPNMVLVMADDMGFGDLGFTGNPLIETPNLDAMARRSARLSGAGRPAVLSKRTPSFIKGHRDVTES